ncbi:MAG: mechanosensitive ion channel family protein [Acidimicrobiia bacterium]|nr:mechanosensitive ion channel family protein [Acidimicrobiia bacterium]MDH3470101.1 mechanosensitive ion channel family protein [Acidimicrobiia bacterium]
MVSWLEEALDISATTARLLVSLFLILLLGLIRWAGLAYVHRKVEDPAVWYRARKITSYTVWIVGLIVLIFLWVEGNQFTTYLGLVSAGLAIALSDPIKDLAGWLYIVLRRPFRIGDRIEVDGNIGDVVDIRVFRFSMLEVGNWVDADQSTGRIMHVPNLVVFTKPIANYSEGFQFVWHEVPVLVTFESDWEKTDQIVAAALDEHAPHHDPARAQLELRQSMSAYQIRYTHTTPSTYLTVRDSGVLVTGRILVEVRKRRVVEAAIWKSILTAIASEPDVELAYPTTRIYRADDPAGGPLR